MAEYLKQGWPEQVERAQDVIDTVSRILSDIEREGLPAIRRYSEQFDRWLSTDWPTVEVAGGAWRDHGTVVVCASREEVVRVSDAVPGAFIERAGCRQPPQLRVALHRTRIHGRVLRQVHRHEPRPPTGRAARYTGGLWVGKFLKTVTYQRLTADGPGTIAPSTAAIADAELMLGHALTARLRL